MLWRRICDKPSPQLVLNHFADNFSVTRFLCVYFLDKKSPIDVLVNSCILQLFVLKVVVAPRIVDHIIITNQ